MMKLKIREQSIKYATAKKVKMSRREGELEKEINFLQNFIESNEISPNEKKQRFLALSRPGNGNWKRLLSIIPKGQF